MTDTVYLYADGACRGNPGPGGWGVLLQYLGKGPAKGLFCDWKEKELSGGEMDTTNNRMELMAVIRGLEALTRPCSVYVFTDSAYVAKGITEWLPNWVRKGWKTANRTPVKNVDLWQRLLAAQQRHQVRWHWVKGHAGHPGNERADRLANKGIDELLANRRKESA